MSDRVILTLCEVKHNELGRPVGKHKDRQQAACERKICESLCECVRGASEKVGLCVCRGGGGECVFVCVGRVCVCVGCVCVCVVLTSSTSR